MIQGARSYTDLAQLVLSSQFTGTLHLLHLLIDACDDGGDDACRKRTRTKTK